MMGVLPSFKDWKIGYKINTIIVVTMLSSLFVALTGIVAYDHSVRRELLAEELYILAAITGKRSSAAIQFFDHRAAKSNLDALRINHMIQTACIYRSNGTIFTFMDELNLGSQVPRYCANTLPVPGVYFYDEFIEIVTDIELQNEKIGAVYIRASLQKVNARLHHSIAVSILIMLGSLFLSLLLSMPLQQRVVNPIIGLRDLARDVSKKKDFTVRLEVDRKDEIGDTSEAFNLMLATIEKSNDELYKLAYFDNLTGLANRRRFISDLELTLVKTRYGKKQLALMILNIDGFQAINEELGHDVGDLLLQQLSRRFESELPKWGKGYRLGSDEFAVVLKQIDSKEAAAAVAELLQSAIVKPMDLAGNIVSVSVSIGLAMSGGFDTCFSILKRADQALNQAKSRGRNIYQIADDFVHKE